MDTFQWNPCFVTGQTEVDSQHHRLVDIINQFGDLLMQQGEAPAAELETVIAKLANYAHYHFAEEEALMTAMRLDARHIAQHRQIHGNFLAEVSSMHDGCLADGRQTAKPLLQFLTHWLAYHILGTDQEMARQIKAIKAGARPEDAFLNDAPDTDPATTALLSALNGLFQQVSERNQQLVQLNRTLEARVEERTRALSEANRRLDDLANTDALTGLPNRRFALLSLAAEWNAARRDDTPLSCMMIDADGFKTINDTHGHDAGDEVLRVLSNALRDTVRTDDLVCRLGGDEFLIICTRTPLDGAMQLAESIRRSVAALCVKAGSGEWCGSVSIGVATSTAEMSGPDNLMKAADNGVYQAKRNGRNCVALAGN